MSEPFPFPEPSDDKIPAQWLENPPWKTDPDLADLVEIMQPLEHDYWFEGGQSNQERELFLEKIEARWQKWKNIARSRRGLAPHQNKKRQSPVEEHHVTDPSDPGSFSDQKEIGLPLAGGALEDERREADSEFPGIFRDIKPPHTTGTRVPGQISNSANERERHEREREKLEAEVARSMYPKDREKYNDPETTDERRATIFETYKAKLEERKRREEAEFQREIAKTAEAQDLLHRIKKDPTKAHLPRPADDSKEELLKWHDRMSLPMGRPFYGGADDGTGTGPYPAATEHKAKSETPKPKELSTSTGDTLQHRQEISLELADAASDSMRDDPPSPASTVKTVWAFIRKYVAVGGAFLLGACWTMLQIDEYALALLLLIVGMAAFSIQIYDWKGIDGHSKATRFLKGVAAILILFSLIYFSAVIVKRRQGKPWSILLDQSKPPITSAPSPSPLPSAQGANRTEGHFPSGYSVIADTPDVTISFFTEHTGSLITFKARIGYSSNESMMRLVIDLPKGSEVEVAQYAGEHRQEITERAKAAIRERHPEFLDISLDAYMILNHSHRMDPSLIIPLVKAGKGPVLVEGPD